MSSILHQRWATGIDQAPTAEQIERGQRAHASGLTPAQRDRLNADHANNYDTTAVENRRDYTGPRWPWLCG